MDREQLIQLAEEKYRNNLVAQAEAKYAQEQSTSKFQPEAFKQGALEGITLGLKPLAEGAGAGLGSFVGNMEMGKSLKESAQSGIEDFQRGRKNAADFQRQLSKDYPMETLAGNFAGSLPLAIAYPANTLKSALKLGAATGIGQAAGSAGSLPGAAADVALGTLAGPLGYYGGKAIGKGAEYVGKGLKKAASTFSGIPEGDINAYLKNTKIINDLMKQYGNDFSTAADEVKGKINKAIQNTRKSINNIITAELRNADPNRRISVDPLIASLQNERAKLHPITQEEAIKGIDEIIDLIKRTAKYSTQDEQYANPKDYFHIYDMLKEKSKRFYSKQGQIFNNSPAVSKAANNAYGISRQTLSTEAPNVSNALGELHLLRDIESKMPRSLLRQGKQEGPLFAAGSGVNKRTSNILESLDAITGKQGQESAKELAANMSSARSFNGAGLLPSGPQTGQMISRMALPMLGGGLIAHKTDSDTTTMALLGAALSSPAALKQYIKLSKIPRQTINKSIDLLKNPTSKSILTKNLSQQMNMDSNKVDEKLSAIERRLMLLRGTK